MIERNSILKQHIKLFELGSSYRCPTSGRHVQGHWPDSWRDFPDGVWRLFPDECKPSRICLSVIPAAKYQLGGCRVRHNCWRHHCIWYGFCSQQIEQVGHSSYSSSSSMVSNATALSGADA